MTLVRRACLLVAGALATAGVTLPAAGAPAEPTTLLVEGTLRVVAIDTFGVNARSEHLYTVVTDDGAEISIDLAESDEASANGRFRGELVVAGAVATSLKRKDLLPPAGSTITEDTRAGRAAVAVAEQEEAPLTVASSTVSPATAAAVTTPAPHRAYVAVLSNRGTVEESDAQVATLVNTMTSYWVSESSGVISSFGIQGTVKRFLSSSAGTPEQSCGMGSPAAVWNEAAQQFPGVSFATGSRNHLIVAMANECGEYGAAGVAYVGVDLSSGGPMTFSLGSIATQVGVHEIGHTFGFGHANLATCTDDCEYFDLYSPMALAVSGGIFAPPALGTLYRSRLGVAGTSEVTDVSLEPGQTSMQQSFALAPRPGPSGLRGLLVTDPSTGARYSVDWRNRTARDAGTFYGSNSAFSAPLPTYPSGVVIEREDDTGDIALMTRTVSGRAVGSFGGGTVFSPSGGLTVTVNLIGSTAGVTVRLGSPEIQSATPSISGRVAVDQTVTAVPGAWESGASFVYDWRLDDVSTGATGSTFAIPSTASGAALTVRVTGSKSGTTSVTRESAGTPVARGTLTSGTVSVSGSPVIGQTLTAVTGTWTPAPTFGYTWSIDGSVVGSEQTFVVPEDALGKTVTLAVTGTRTGYAPRTVSVVTSAVTAQGLPPIQSANPTVGGTVAVGRTVMVDAGTWTSGAALTYDWMLDGVSTGEKGTSYAIPVPAAGRTLTVAVTGTRAGFASDTRASSGDVVALGTFGPGSVSSSGAAVVNSTVTAVATGWPAGVPSYQWQRNGEAIAGATSSTFTVPPSFVGAQLRVVATGTQPGYAPAAAASTPATVAAARFVPRTPRITGTARVGKTLTVKVGSWSPRPSFRYQWYANGKKITRMSAKGSFKLTSRQKGKRITVRVTARKTGYATITKSSRSTKKVARRR